MLDRYQQELLHKYFAASTCVTYPFDFRFGKNSLHYGPIRPYAYIAGCGSRGLDFILSLGFVICSVMASEQIAELAAAQAIQKFAKGFLVRSRLRRISTAALIIQKVWRGYLGRLRYSMFRKRRNKLIRQVWEQR